MRPIEGFEKIKTVYTKKRREAERAGDEAIAARVGHISCFLCVRNYLAAEGSLAHNHIPMEMLL